MVTIIKCKYSTILINSIKIKRHKTTSSIYREKSGEKGVKALGPSQCFLKFPSINLQEQDKVIDSRPWGLLSQAEFCFVD